MRVWGLEYKPGRAGEGDPAASVFFAVPVPVPDLVPTLVPVHPVTDWLRGAELAVLIQ